MRASRLLSILLLLQAREQMTAQELADTLEVSLRTVYRDVDSLNEAGVPVVANRGPAGGYHLLEGYRTRLTGLTQDEAAALFLAGVPTAAAGLGFGSAMDSAQLKLLAALPSRVRACAEHLRTRFHMDPTPWYREDDQSPHLQAVAAAVLSQRVLQVQYQRWEGEVQRRLEPLGIVQKGGMWYLVARAEQRIHTYRVSRIRKLAVLEEHFERPAGFDLTAYWQSWLQQFQSSLYQGQATVRLAPRAFSRLADLFPPAVVRAAHATVGPVDQHGWRTVVIPIESVEQAVSDFLRLGIEAEVMAPHGVRQCIAETLRALLPLYDVDSCPSPEATPE